MSKANLKAVALDDEFADAVSEALEKDDAPSTQPFITNFRNALGEGIATLRERQIMLQKRVSAARRQLVADTAELHDIGETLAAVEPAHGKLAAAAG